MGMGMDVSRWGKMGAGGYCYRYNGKEFSEDLGLYDYGARWYDPAIGRFTTIDPAADVYSSISPYAYVANNPLIYIDPTGAYIEEGSQKEWEKQTGRVKERRDKLQSKLDGLSAKAADKGWSAEKLAKRVGNLSGRVESLNSTISTFGTLESSSQGYSLSKVGAEQSATSLNTENNVIDIAFDGTSTFVHEVTHAGQFESGDLGFDSSTGASLLGDLSDEVASYKAQFAYDPASVATASSFGDITSDFVSNITLLDGSKPYSLGGVANTGRTPLSINSTNGDLVRAYPNIIKLGFLSKKTPVTKTLSKLYYKKQ